MCFFEKILLEMSGVRFRIGTRIDPCGTPKGLDVISDFSLLNSRHNIFYLSDMIQTIYLPFPEIYSVQVYLIVYYDL